MTKHHDDDAPSLLDATAAETLFMHRCDELKANASYRRRHDWLELNRAGVTYPVLAQRCGVSERTVNKELARAREENGER